MVLLYQSKRFSKKVRQDEWCGLRTSELIYPENIIINGFHFLYPLNGT